MNKIRVLDEQTAGQIAAGEVIERPAGVLKELLENSLDAGAQHVRVDIEEGGRTLIRVNDDGCGMTPQDLAASVLRHATSKITRFDDLNTLRTFGFRGEALYSVAAVSKLTLTSCTEGGEGSRLEVQGGKVLGQSPAPAIRGTTVEIRDLFFNVPARQKFLKSTAYERACLLKVVEESALANLSVAYTVASNGREVYRLPAQNADTASAVRARAKDIMGQEIGQALIDKTFETVGLKIFITPADKLVATRDLQFMFVNRRPVESKTIQQAVYRALQSVRPKDRHPAFIVYMELDPGSFDVNIHPQKRDIRFADEHKMFNQILQAVQDTVFGLAQPVEVKAPQTAQLPAQTPEPPLAAMAQQITPAPQASVELFETPASPAQESFTPKAVFTAREKDDFSVRPEPAAAVQDTAVAAPELPQEGQPSWWKGPYHYLGQLQRSYLVFENPDGLVLIDQHAAQERVLYEQYLDAFERHSVVLQELMFPIHVDLTPSNAESLMGWADWLAEAGFTLARFSARTVLVSTVPSMLRFKEDEMKKFIESLSQIVGDPDKASDSLKRKMVALLACKRAIKAHDQISATEAEALLENMKKCKDGMHCPHGRPCVAVMSAAEIGKLFGR